MSDSDVYHKAYISRQIFSNIRCDSDYTPKKDTILCLAIALQLTLDETGLLLKSAGYALSDSKDRDIVISYFIEHKIYNLIELNNFLYEQKLDTFKLTG